jgi:hypothetical protein
MTQALYAHMNDEKKKDQPVQFHFIEEETWTQRGYYLLKRVSLIC